MKRKLKFNHLFVNTSSAVIQTLVYTILLAILYRNIIDKLGISKLGLWAIILSTTSLAGLSNSGVGSSITKFVSHYYAKDAKYQIVRILQSAPLLISIVTGPLTIVFFLVFRVALHYFVKDHDLILEGIKLLPLSFTSLFISSIAGIYLSGLDGIHKIYLRSTIVIFSTIVYVTLSILFIPYSGLLGIAYAQLIQSIIILIIPAFILVYQLKSISILKIQWHKEVINEIFKYSIRLQFITILQIITDPIVKLYLTAFGNIQITGYYDMSLKLVNGLRSLIVSATQATIPEISKLKSLGKNKELLSIFLKSDQIVTILSILIFPSLAGISLLISKVWLGHIDHEFVITLDLVCLGYFINILSVPFYFLNISTGNLKSNMASALYSTICVIILGILFGELINTYGVIIAWIIASLIGTLILHVKFIKEYLQTSSTYFRKDFYLFILVSILNIFTFIEYSLWMNNHLKISILISLIIYFVLTLYVVYKDKRILGLIKWQN